jgi:MFS family permease
MFDGLKYFRIPDKKTVFHRGIGNHVMNIITLLAGFFGGFVINLLSNPFPNRYAIFAFIGFAAVVISLFLLIYRVELFKKLKEWVRENNRLRPLSEDEIFEQTLVDYPEFKFVSRYTALLWCTAIFLAAAIGLLRIANATVRDQISAAASVTERADSLTHSAIVQLEQRIIRQDSVIHRLDDSLLSMDRFLRKALVPVKKKKPQH